MFKRNRILLLAILLIVSFLSGFVFKNPAVYGWQTRKLDEKRETVMTVAAISAAAATAIAAVPDDATTPVADQIAELSAYSIVIFLIILIEKYLCASSGFLTFQILLPVSFALLMIDERVKRFSFKRLAYRLMVLALCLFLIVPISLWIEDGIDNAFDTSASIRAITKEDVIEAEMNATEETEEAEKKNIFEAAGDFFSSTLSKAKNLKSEAVSLLNNYIDAFVALIFKDCVMPILTFLLMYLVCKHLLTGIVPSEIKEDTRQLVQNTQRTVRVRSARRAPVKRIK